MAENVDDTDHHDDDHDSSSEETNLTTPPEIATAPPLSGSSENQNGVIYDEVGSQKKVTKKRYPQLPSSDWSESRLDNAESGRHPTRSELPAQTQPGQAGQAGSAGTGAQATSQSRDPALHTARLRAEIHRENEIIQDLDMDIALNEELSQNLHNEAVHRLDERDIIATKQELLNARKEHRERVRHLSGQIDRQEFGP